MDFIDRLKNFREDNDLKQGEFAGMLGIPPSTLSNWENRTRGVPEARRNAIEDFMANYQQKFAQKGLNRVTKAATGSTVDSKLEADATRLGLAVVAVRRAEIDLAKLEPAYEAAKAALEKAQISLEQLEAELLSKIG